MDEYLKTVIDTNGIECLPEDVQAKYVISDCFVYVDLTDELINYWKDDIATTIKDIAFREKDYEETNSENVWWDTDESVKAQSYYFSTLCGYSGNLHKPYGEYLKRLETAQRGEDLFAGIGLGDDAVSTSSSNVINNKSDAVDLSWLDKIT